MGSSRRLPDARRARGQRRSAKPPRRSARRSPATRCWSAAPPPSSSRCPTSRPTRSGTSRISIPAPSSRRAPTTMSDRPIRRTIETTIKIERQSEVAVPKAKPDPVVEQVQAILQSMNLYAGDVDGIAGPNTRKAIEAYRKTMGMAVSGDIDDALARTARRRRHHRRHHAEAGSRCRTRGRSRGRDRLGQA